MTWRVYPPIDDVMTFGAIGEGPVLRRVNVTAMRIRGDRRIRIVTVGVGLLSLTPEQSAELRLQLEQAERDILAGVEQDPPEVSDG